MKISIDVKATGPLFTGRAGQAAIDAMKTEAIDKVRERWLRPGRRIGRRRNTLTDMRHGDLVLDVSTTLRHPRQSGSSWQKKQIAIGKSMAPRVLRKAARRLIDEVGG